MNNSNSTPFKVGKLNDRRVVIFRDPEGKRVRIRLQSTDFQEAVLEANRIYEAHVKEWEAGKQWTIKELWSDYQSHLKGRPASKKMSSEAKVILPFFGGYFPQEISQEMVADYISQRNNQVTGKTVSDGTLWTELGRLRDAISYGVKNRKVGRGDVPFIPRPRKPAPRDRWLKDEEILRLLSASESTPHLYLAIQILIGTAARVTAALELTWDRVDFEAGKIDLRLPSSSGRQPTKNRSIVPMTPSLRSALQEAHRHRTTDHVIEFHGRPIKSIKTAFTQAVRQANLDEGVTPHTIRHTAAVKMVAAGCEMERVRAFLGHRSIQTTREIYAKFAPDHLRAEAEALDLTLLLKK